MGRKKSYIPLDVYIGQRIVGQLGRDSGGAYSFQYSPEWLSWEMRFPISLSLPVRADRYTGQTVINVFENLLPDHDGIRRRVATKVGATGTDAFSMLSKIGRDCVGAMQFLPEGSSFEPSGKIEGRELSVAEIEKILNNLGIAPLGLGENDAFRISIAGAQEKTALLYHDGKWLEPHGPTPTTHIIKPQIGKLDNGIDLSDSVENEHFCLKLLSEFGLPTAKTEITQFGEKKALIIERFDRHRAKDRRLIRLPQEDLCQALSVPPTLKYQDSGGPGIVDIAKRLNNSDTPEEDRLTFFKANILFWLMGATDGHAKNFSIFIGPGGTFRLTPLYDVLTIQPSFDKNHIDRKQMRMSMSVGRRRRYRAFDISGKDFVFTGQKAGFSEKQIKNIIEAIEHEWQPAFYRACADLNKDFPDHLLDSLSNAFKMRIPQLRTPVR